MAEEKDTGRGLVAGGIGGTLLGATITALLLGKPAKAAPSEEKLDYLIECLTTLIPVLAEVAEGNAQLIALLQQWLAAQGIPGEGVEVTVKAPWVAKEPEVIFDRAITSVGTFDGDKMVNWTKGKRLVIKVESLLDQDCDIQVVGNITDNYYLATNIPPVETCLAHGNISIGLAWDDWFPFIGVRITTAIAPTSGLLTISAVVQE